jgi:hypothetical protein
MTDLAFRATALAGALRTREFGCGEMLATATFPAATVTIAPPRLTAKALPIGEQIVGPQCRDKSCIAGVGLLESTYRGCVALPGCG